MLKLSLAQLNEACVAAAWINSLEAAKDSVRAETVRLRIEHPFPKSKEDPLGQGPALDYQITAAAIRLDVENRIKAAHAQLRDLGIDLVL